MSKKDLTPKIARWALLLEDFRYTIEHRAGDKLRHVDALSRYPVFTIAASSIVSKIKKAQEEDDEIKAVKELLKDREYEDYYVRKELLYKFKNGRELLVIPQGMEDELIRATHEKGHLSVKKTV